MNRSARLARWAGIGAFAFFTIKGLAWLALLGAAALGVTSL